MEEPQGVDRGKPLTHQPERLLRLSPEDYGQDYHSHLLEQYKLFVGTAERISTSRMSANNYLLTVNAFLVTLYGIAPSFGSSLVWKIAIPIAGILVCIAWLALIRSYRNLNAAKYRVIHEIEQHLPAALFEREWDVSERGVGRAYRPLTHIEPCIPWVYGFLYLTFLICAVWSEARGS